MYATLDRVRCTKLAHPVLERFFFLVKLQSIWSQMKYHYHNLVHRQILHKERFNTKWEHFEPMSFMYNITVSKIVGAQSSSAAVVGAEHGAATDEAALSSGSPPTPLPVTLTVPLPTATHGRGRPSSTFSWATAAAAAAAVAAAPTLPLHFSLQQPPPAPAPAPPPPTTTSHSYTAFTGLVPPAAVTVEARTTPQRKLGRPSSLHNSMRGRIIDAIKARPTLWAGRQRSEKGPGPGQGQSRSSAVWKEAAHEMGLTASK